MADIIKYSFDSIDEIATRLKRGEVGIFPCDTIYGICASTNEKNAERIYAIKNRPQSKRFIILIDKEDLATSPFIVPEELLSLWPNPLTMIVNTKTGDTQALRVPSDPFLQKLLPLSGPIFSTSVNLSGSPSLLSFSSIFPVFENRVDFIVEKDDEESGMSSTLVDVTKKPYRVIRQGAFKFNL